jgi:hypothetical protein
MGRGMVGEKGNELRAASYKLRASGEGKLEIVGVPAIRFAAASASPQEKGFGERNGWVLETQNSKLSINSRC